MKKKNYLRSKCRANVVDYDHRGGKYFVDEEGRMKIEKDENRAYKFQDLTVIRGPGKNHTFPDEGELSHVGTLT